MGSNARRLTAGVIFGTLMWIVLPHLAPTISLGWHLGLTVVAAILGAFPLRRY